MGKMNLFPSNEPISAPGRRDSLGGKGQCLFGQIFAIPFFTARYLSHFFRRYPICIYIYIFPIYALQNMGFYHSFSNSCIKYWVVKCCKVFLSQYFPLNMTWDGWHAVWSPPKKWWSFAIIWFQWSLLLIYTQLISNPNMDSTQLALGIPFLSSPKKNLPSQKNPAKWIISPSKIVQNCYVYIFHLTKIPWFSPCLSSKNPTTWPQAIWLASAAWAAQRERTATTSTQLQETICQARVPAATAVVLFRRSLFTMKNGDFMGYNHELGYHFGIYI